MVASALVGCKDSGGYGGRVTTATTPHPPARRSTSALDEAATALAARSFYSRYPESPSPRVYGETAG